MAVQDKHKKEIIHLYFNEMYTFEMLLERFKNIYTYAELKSFIINYIKESKC